MPTWITQQYNQTNSNFLKITKNQKNKRTKETGKARHPIVTAVAPKGGATNALGSSSYKRTKPLKLGTSKSVV